MIQNLVVSLKYNFLFQILNEGPFLLIIKPVQFKIQICSYIIIKDIDLKYYPVWPLQW